MSQFISIITNIYLHLPYVPLPLRSSAGTFLVLVKLIYSVLAIGAAEPYQRKIHEFKFVNTNFKQALSTIQYPYYYFILLTLQIPKILFSFLLLSVDLTS